MTFSSSAAPGGIDGLFYGGGLGSLGNQFMAALFTIVWTGALEVRDDVEVREGRTDNEDADFGESYLIREYYELQGAEDDSIRGCIEIEYEGGLFHEGDIDVDASYTSSACS